MLAAAAQFERHGIKERISKVKADQRERGVFLGGNRPLGWAVGDDGLLVEVPEEQAARARILELRAGGASLRRIAAIISADWFPISHAGVDRVLRHAPARSAQGATAVLWSGRTEGGFSSEDRHGGPAPST